MSDHGLKYRLRAKLTDFWNMPHVVLDVIVQPMVTYAVLSGFRTNTQIVTYFKFLNSRSPSLRINFSSFLNMRRVFEIR